MFTAELRYKYKGFEYRTWDDVEEDNIKTFHYCYRRRAEDGHLIEVGMPAEFYNHSPYDLVPVEKFKKYVDEIALVEFVQSK